MRQDYDPKDNTVKIIQYGAGGLTMKGYDFLTPASGILSKLYQHVADNSSHPIKVSVSFVLVSLIMALSGFVTPSHAGFIENGVPIITAAGDQTSPRIIACPNRSAVIVWRDLYEQDEIRAQKIDEKGNLLWPPEGVRVSTDSWDQGNPEIVSDDSGGIFVVWMQDDKIKAQHIDSNGTPRWTAAGIYVCESDGDQDYPDICRDSGDGCIISWRDKRSPGSGIYAQRILGDGTVAWIPEGIAVIAMNFPQYNPHICRDGQGGAIVAWDKENIWAQRVRANGTIAWADGGVLICDTDYIQENAKLEYDNRFGAVLVWLGWLNFTREVASVMTQSIDSLGTSRWPSNGIRLNNGSDMQEMPDFTVDSDGGSIIAWLEYGWGVSFPCSRVQRISPLGQAMWVGGRTISDNGDCLNIFTTTDGDDGALFVWADRRADAGNVYTQNINSVGTLCWPAEGIPISTVAGMQTGCTICSDGAGGAMMAWQDLRNGTDFDIYAASVNSSGDPVATFLTSFEVSRNGSDVLISWMISEMTEGIVFEVSRTSAPDEGFSPLGNPDTRSGFDFSFTDSTCEPGATYRYRVTYIEDDSRHILFESDEVDIPAGQMALYQNRPNPFNPATTIRFDLPGTAGIRLDIYNIRGELVTILADRVMSGGINEITWDGTNRFGREVSSGVYFCTLKSNKGSLSRKMVLFR